MKLAEMLSGFSVVLEVTLLLRLLQLGLARQPFKAFRSMLLVGIFRDIILFFPASRSHTYTLTWELTLPAALVAHSIAGVGTYQAIAALYPKMGRFAVWLFSVALLLSGIACCAGLPFETRRIGGAEATLRTLFLLDRWTHTLIAGALLLAVGFLSRFPRPAKKLPRNLMLHTVLLFCYFGSYVVGPFIFNLFALGHTLVTVDLQLFFISALFALWTTYLTRDGHETEPWPQLSPEALSAIEGQNKAAVDLAKQAARDAFDQAKGRK